MVARRLPVARREFGRRATAAAWFDGGVTEAPPAAARRIPDGKLAGWALLVLALAGLSYLANALANADSGDIPDDLLYRWSTAVAAVIQYALILAVVLWIARGLDRGALGLVRPGSWPRAAGLVVVGFLVTAAAAVALNPVLEAGKEQGLVPDEWDPSRAAPFVANFVVVTIVAPVVEELTYRGLGVAVVRDRFGAAVAVAVTGVAFGLAHGLLVALPILTLFGVVLAVVRLRTQSLYPAIALHAVFNGLSLLGAVLEVGS